MSSLSNWYSFKRRGARSSTEISLQGMHRSNVAWDPDLKAYVPKQSYHLALANKETGEKRAYLSLSKEDAEKLYEMLHHFLKEV